jgi:DNA-directed RNA polymerase specialized sigma24 family protein
MRAVLALHDVADLPTSEIAVALGRSENTIKSQLREARARLRQALLDDPMVSNDRGRGSRT